MIPCTPFSNPRYGTAASCGNILIDQVIACVICQLIIIAFKLNFNVGLVTFILSWPYRQGFCYI
jgi:hypothetical protein